MTLRSSSPVTLWPGHDIVFLSKTFYFDSLTVPLSTHVYKQVQVNLIGLASHQGGC